MRLPVICVKFLRGSSGIDVQRAVAPQKTARRERWIPGNYFIFRDSHNPDSLPVHAANRAWVTTAYRFRSNDVAGAGGFQQTWDSETAGAIGRTSPWSAHLTNTVRLRARGLMPADRRSNACGRCHAILSFAFRLI